MPSASAAVPGTTCPCCPSRSGLTPPALVRQMFTVCLQKPACPRSVFFSLVRVEGRGFLVCFLRVFSFFFFFGLTVGHAGSYPDQGSDSAGSPKGRDVVEHFYMY